MKLTEKQEKQIDRVVLVVQCSGDSFIGIEDECKDFEKDTKAWAVNKIKSIIETNDD